MCYVLFIFFFFKQKTAYEMRISDWSSDVCSSDRVVRRFLRNPGHHLGQSHDARPPFLLFCLWRSGVRSRGRHPDRRVEALDRKEVVEGKRELVRVDFGGRSIIKKTN